MAFTLSSACARVWRELGYGYDFQATGGSTVSVVDANCQFTSDDAYIGGSVVVIRDAGGAGAAPEGEFAVISDYTASSKTFAIGNLTSGIAAGDDVFIASPKIKLRQMIQSINDGIADLGWIGAVDTSIVTAAQQTEYALPVALKADDVLDVLYPQNSDSNDNQWISIKSDAHVETAAPGTTGILYLPQFEAGTTIKIIYHGMHPRLTTYSSVISETIPQALVVAAGVEKAIAWIVKKKGQSAMNSVLIQHLNDAKQTLANYKIEHPIYRPKRKPRWFSVGQASSDQEFYVPPPE